MEEPHGDSSALARGYLDALLRGDPTRAAVVVTQARERGLSAPRIYLEMLAPAQEELGSLWRRKRLSVAQEHLATEITLHEMEKLRQGSSRAVGPGRASLSRPSRGTRTWSGPGCWPTSS